MFRTDYFIIYLLLIPTLFIGCGEDEAPPASSSAPTVIGSGGTSDTQTTSDGNARDYLTYTRLTNTDGPNAELIVFDMRAQEEIILNEGISKDDVDCYTRGCFLHPNLEYVAWLQPNGNKNDLFVAPIDAQSRRINVMEKRKLSEDALRLSFTQNNIIFLEMKDAEALNGVAVMTVPVSGDMMPREVALVNPNGGYKATLADDLIILVKTTLSSMTLSFLNTDTDQQFDLTTFGMAGGAGSEFSASTNPVGFAPDNSYLVSFTNFELTWRLHSLDVTSTDINLQTQDLFPTLRSDQVCTADIKFDTIMLEPVFSSDSEHFYMLMSGDCTKREYPMLNRRDHDIYRFSRDISAPPVNITRIVRVNNWSNHDITEFALSPDDQKLAFVATRPNKNGTKSIWLMNVSTGEELPTFDCSRGEEMLDPSAHPRCEYIFHDVEGSVDYRNLTFVRASGL